MHKRVKKIAVLAWNDRWSISIWRAFQKIAENVEVIHVNEKSPKEVAALIEKAKPDLCFSKNFRVAEISSERAESDLEEIFSGWKFPLAVWYLDNPKFQDELPLRKRWSMKPYPSNILFFYNDPSFKTFFDDRDLSAHHLPIGVDDIIFNLRYPQFESELQAGLRFTGHPIARCELPEVNLKTIAMGHVSLLLNELEDLLLKSLNIANEKAVSLVNSIEQKLYEYFSEYYIHPDRYFSKTAEFFLKCEKILPSAIFQQLRVMESRIGEIYSWWQLTSYLHLLTEQGIIIQGSEDWSPFFPNQKEECRELRWEELFASYRATKISFCFTKWSLPYAVHDRIYEVLAAGGFPLTDYRQELAHHFEKDEITVYSSIEEAKDLIQFYTKNESARLQLIEKGRARVAKDHTYQERLNRLLDKSAEHFGI